MNISGIIASLTAKIKNIFCVSDFVRREKNKIQVKTPYGRTLELPETFPYGFITKAKAGRVIVLCEGGNLDNVLILPVCSTNASPEIQEGDTALYNESTAIILHEDTITINGEQYGGLIKVQELKKELEKNNAILQAILNVCKVPIPEPGNGSPSAFQATLNTTLGSMNVANYSNIENEKVKHG